MGRDAAGRVGIVVNPMSGRDVRRVAARASTSTHSEKQRQVTRLVLGALSAGATEILLADDPFSIGRRAVEHLPGKERFRFLTYPLTHTAADTRSIVASMAEAHCDALISLGGDGTNRIIAGTWQDVVLLPLSTGTNNVFPIMVEATTAGIATGLVASGRVALDDATRRAKVVHISVPARGLIDLALVDAALVRDDSLGNLMPFRAAQMADLVLARAEPASVGMSPVGGYLEPAGETDDFGVHVACGEPATRSIVVPLSPGLHETVPIADVQRLAFGTEIVAHGPGVLAFDGDRTIALAEDEVATLTVRRDGPRVIDPREACRVAAAAGAFEV